MISNIVDKKEKITINNLTNIAYTGMEEPYLSIDSNIKTTNDSL